MSRVPIGKMLIDTDAEDVFVDGKRIGLTLKEFSVLERLMISKGRLVERGVILHYLYGGKDEPAPAPKIIDVFICKLRRKLAAATNGDHYISTVRGRGYVIRTPMEERTK